MSLKNWTLKIIMAMTNEQEEQDIRSGIRGIMIVPDNQHNQQ